jgi:hypothetical protein
VEKNSEVVKTFISSADWFRFKNQVHLHKVKIACEAASANDAASKYPDVKKNQRCWIL